MARTDYRQLPFLEAILFFLQKLNIPTDTSDDVIAEEHDAVFVVAGAKGDLLSDIRQAVTRAIEQGTTLEDFRRDFDEIVATRGWQYKGGRDWRTETIYGTNMRTAYGAGRYEQMTDPEVLRLRPYWQWIHGDSRHPRPIHLALDGQIYPANSPFWNSMYPPSGWGCRCRVVSLSKRDLDGQESGEAPEIGSHMDVTDPETGERVSLRVEPDEGWDHTPGATTAGQRRAIRQQVLERLPADLRAQVEREVAGGDTANPN